jgi:hypothetical protein
VTACLVDTYPAWVWTPCKAALSLETGWYRVKRYFAILRAAAIAALTPAFSRMALTFAFAALDKVRTYPRYCPWSFSSARRFAVKRLLAVCSIVFPADATPASSVASRWRRSAMSASRRFRALATSCAAILPSAMRRWRACTASLAAIRIPVWFFRFRALSPSRRLGFYRSLRRRRMLSREIGSMTEGFVRRLNTSGR